MDQQKIRNFCIIAHIDHGKSTLADRLIETTQTVSKREMKEQLLDQMDIERERGITIKLQPVRMEYKRQGQDDKPIYVLNLIDTPGHVDFSYEVSRSLAACEGAILVVDAQQGVQAQTLANVYLAIEHDLAIIPVVNKIDLPNANLDQVAAEIENIFGFKKSEIIPVSAKTGQGVDKLLEAIVERIPAPKGKISDPFRALIFDSIYDTHRGVVAYVRIIDGSLKKGQVVKMLGANVSAAALEVGYFRPKLRPSETISAGEVGYIVTGLRDVRSARVGDTIALLSESNKVHPLPGYKEITPMVYADFFPISGDDFSQLRAALEKLALNDASLTYQPEHIPSLGHGFRLGFLGLLHLEIIQERLSREFGVDVIATAPSVAYRVKKKDKSSILVKSAADLPDPSSIESIEEPWVDLSIVTPKDYVGSILELITGRRGIFKNMEYVGANRTHIQAEMPLSSVIIDFYDKLKSATSGYASMNYQFKDYRANELVKLDILVAGERVEALSTIVHKSEALSTGRVLVEKLKDLIPRQQFEVPIQAAIGGKIIARETVKALRKDVTGYLYGGDVTRKMKLLKKQKEGKKRMKQVGKVSIPQEAFLAILKK